MNKKVLTVAIASALAVPMAAQAVNYKLSGQINRAIRFADDGTTSDVQHVDNTTSGSRFRFRGSEDIGNGMKAGIYWEWQWQSNPSSSKGIKTSDVAPTLAERWSEVWFSGRWGKLSVGQGDGAGNGTAEKDLSGTSIIDYSARNSISGGVRFINKGTPTATSRTSVSQGATTSNFDALSRYDRVRYDTPALGPVVISGSHGNNDRYELAGQGRNALGGGTLEYAAGWWKDENTRNSANPAQGYQGSISFLFSQGTSLTGSYGKRDFKGNIAQGTRTDDTQNWWLKAGHKWGNNAVSLSYGETEDLNVKGDKNKGFQVGFVHNMPKPKVELYAGYQYSEMDGQAGENFDDLNVVMVGSRIKF